MNYFAHARLAATRRDDPYYVLGAMLPDWTAWVGDRLRHVEHASLAAGVRFHHESDAAFHAGARFVALVRESSRSLQAAGLGRGPARGAAHIGIELLLDGALLAEENGVCAYDAALAVAPAASLHLAWGRPESARRFEQISRRLARQGPPRGLVVPERVAAAVVRTLDRRPRLRVPPRDLPALIAWARNAQPRVRRDVPALLAETEAGLRPDEAA
jgi:hypothetical protein